MPKSLADIDNLPYDLQGCKHQNGYYDFTKNTDEADYVETNEECRLETEDRKYEIDFYFVEHFRAIHDTHGTLKIKNTDTQTGILILLETDENGDIAVDFQEYPVVYSVKSAGICNPMRQ